MTDPETVALTAELGGREDVLRAVAAERALLDADRVRRAVTSLGADAVSATPYELPPRVADRYLELKKAGRL